MRYPEPLGSLLHGEYRHVENPRARCVRMLILKALIAAVCLGFRAGPVASDGDLLKYEEVVLADFETDAELARWRLRGGIELSRTDQWSSQCKYAGRIVVPQWEREQ